MEEVKKLLEEVKAKLVVVDEVREELYRLREAQERKEYLIPRFVESSPQTRTYSQFIEELICPTRYSYTHVTPLQQDDFIHIMGYFDQVMLDKLIPKAKQIKIITPNKLPNETGLTKKNKDALERIRDAGAEVRMHPMLHARLFCVPKSRFLIIGSGDIQTDCFGGSRFDAGIMSNYPQLIIDAMKFFDKVWQESEPLPHK